MIKTCQHCQTTFEVTSDDLAFYDKVSPIFAGKKYNIPAPELCPACRCQNRISFRNFRDLFHRKCDLSGKAMISMYSPESPKNYPKPFKVYDLDVWWSDQWDALEYGRDFDFTRPFFDQMKELMNDVPKFAVHNTASENCRYSNLVNNSKNCYLVFGCVNDEDCYYGHIVWTSKNCIDGLYLLECELCYECLDCLKCYNLKFSRDCESCIDSAYLVDCRNCQNCFGCVGLRNKQYHIFNKPHTKEEYESFMKNYNFCDPKTAEKTKAQVKALELQHHFAHIHSSNVENCTGDYLYHCKNVQSSFDVKKSEDVKYGYTLKDFKDSEDVNFAVGKAELVYNSITSVGVNILFSHLSFNCSDVLYCDSCFNTQHAFGCVGLKNKKYCILNKQYTKEEYEKLVPKIIEHLQRTSQWGQFFPQNLSPFGYNQTMAQEYFPLSKEEVQAKGWNWHDDIEKDRQYIGPKVQIPENIKEVPDSIVNIVLTCEVSGRPYKIIPHELEFYRKQNLPIPRKCFEQRHKERMALRNPRKLWQRQCDCNTSGHHHQGHCEIKFQTTYDPARPEKVYCEQCYLKETY